VNLAYREAYEMNREAASMRLVETYLETGSFAEAPDGGPPRTTSSVPPHLDRDRVETRKATGGRGAPGRLSPRGTRFGTLGRRGSFRPARGRSSRRGQGYGFWP
jgi:hypothetical protein